MPVKRRATKRRLDPVSEAESWACYFHCGFDLLCALHWDLGLDSREAIEAAAPDAWARLGRIYIDHGLGDGFDSHEPWALQQFGEP